MEFSERFKKLRLESGYTQKELANKLGISYQSLQKYEKGINKPKFERLEEIAAFFDVSVSYLLGETDTLTPSNLDKSIILSKRLKKLRLEAGYTQKEVAQKIGMTGSGYSNYGTGTKTTFPRIERLQKLALLFNVSVSYLLGETDERPLNKNEMPETFKERLKRLRISFGITGAELAKVLNFSSRQTYNNYEKGVRFPNAETLEKLANFFDVSVEYLLCETDEPNSSKKE